MGLLSKEEKRYRCFGIKESNKDKVHESAKENVEVGDQYCQIETKSGEVVAAASMGMDDKGKPRPKAFFGTEENVALATKYSLLTQKEAAKKKEGNF